MVPTEKNDKPEDQIRIVNTLLSFKPNNKTTVQYLQQHFTDFKVKHTIEWRYDAEQDNLCAYADGCIRKDVLVSESGGDWHEQPVNGYTLRMQGAKAGKFKAKLKPEYGSGVVYNSPQIVVKTNAIEAFIEELKACNALRPDGTGVLEVGDQYGKIIGKDNKITFPHRLKGLGGFLVYVSSGAELLVNLGSQSMINIAPAQDNFIFGAGASYGGSASVRGSIYAHSFHGIRSEYSKVKMYTNGLFQRENVTDGATTGPEVREINFNVKRGEALLWGMDDGSLTEAEIQGYHVACKNLLFGLAQLVPKPFVPQMGVNVGRTSITVEIDPIVRVGKVYYTLDGTEPTVNSMPYLRPFIVSQPVNLRCITVLDGFKSEVTNGWVSFASEESVRNKYRSTHLMTALTQFVDFGKGSPLKNAIAYLKELQKNGLNQVWAHNDDYGSVVKGKWVISNYVENLLTLFAAATYLDGFTISPGLFPGKEQLIIDRFFADMLGSTALAMYEGRPLFSFYDYTPNDEPKIAIALAKLGLKRSDIKIVGNSRIPYMEGQWIDNVSSLVRGDTDEGVLRKFKTTAPLLDGVISFAVDISGQVISNNTLLNSGAAKFGKYRAVGINGLYTSVSYFCTDYKGLAAQAQAIIDLPIEERPNVWHTITANDDIELSYAEKFMTLFTNGLTYIPALTAGWAHGSGGTRLAFTDHSGISEWIRPWSDAFRHNRLHPSFIEDKLFTWHWLHPADVPYQIKLPAELAALNLPHLNQQWWNATLYSSRKEGDDNGHIEGIRQHLKNEIETFVLAGQFTKPGYLQIEAPDGVKHTSGLITIGYGQITCPQILGVFKVRMLRADLIVIYGECMEITNNMYPGAMNPEIKRVINTLVK